MSVATNVTKPRIFVAHRAARPEVMWAASANSVLATSAESGEGTLRWQARQVGENLAPAW